MNVMELVPFIGIVESRADPTKAGRVKVRALGIHSTDKTLIPTTALPWATPINPCTSASVSGIGTTPSGLLEGTWVFGMFLDGKLAQIPVVLGSIGGVPQDRSEGNVNPVYLDEPDVNRIARGTVTAKTHPIIQMMQSTLANTIPTAARMHSTLLPDSGSYQAVTWTQPSPTANSAYPFNHVTETESGHIIELDDTPGGERVRIIHRNGSMIDMQPSGDVIFKAVKKKYSVTLSDENVLVGGDCNVTVNGTCRLLVNGDFVHNVYGDYHLYVQGNRIQNIGGSDVSEVMTDRSVSIGGNDNLAVHKAFNSQVAFDYSLVVGGILSESVSGDVNVTVGEDYTISVHDNAQLLAGEGMSLGSGGATDLAGDGVVTIKATGQLNVKSSATVAINGTSSVTVDTPGDVDVNGGTIHLN